MTPKFRINVIRVHTFSVALVVFLGGVCLASYIRSSALEDLDEQLIRFRSPGGATVTLPEAEEVQVYATVTLPEAEELQVYQEWEDIDTAPHLMPDSLLLKADIEVIRTADAWKVPFHPGSDSQYSFGDRKGLGLGSIKRVAAGEYALKVVYNLRAEEALVGTEPEAHLALGPAHDSWQRLYEATVYWAIVVSGAVVAFLYTLLAFRFINAVPAEAGVVEVAAAEPKPAVAGKSAAKEAATPATAPEAADDRPKGKRSPEERAELVAKARAIKEARAKAAAAGSEGAAADQEATASAEAKERPHGKRSPEERAELVAKARAIKEARAKAAAAASGGGETVGGVDAPASAEDSPEGAEPNERSRGRRSPGERAELVAKARAIKEARAKAAAAAAAAGIPSAPADAVDGDGSPNVPDGAAAPAAAESAPSPKVTPMTEEEKSALMAMAKEVAVEQAAANATDAMEALAEEARQKASARQARDET